GRHADAVAQRRLRDPDRHLAVQVIAVPGEDVVLAYAYIDVQVAGRRTSWSALAFPGKADSVAVIHSGRDLHLKPLGPLDPPLAMALLTGTGDDLPASTAVRAALLHGEDAALEAHLPAAA